MNETYYLHKKGFLCMRGIRLLGESSMAFYQCYIGPTFYFGEINEIDIVAIIKVNRL